VEIGAFEELLWTASDGRLLRIDESGVEDRREKAS
jgi:hypothetical protein